jgi:hypothetical protein
MTSPSKARLGTRQRRYRASGTVFHCASGLLLLHPIHIRIREVCCALIAGSIRCTSRPVVVSSDNPINRNASEIRPQQPPAIGQKACCSSPRQPCQTSQDLQRHHPSSTSLLPTHRESRTRPGTVRHNGRHQVRQLRCECGRRQGLGYGPLCDVQQCMCDGI